MAPAGIKVLLALAVFTRHTPYAPASPPPTLVRTPAGTAERTERSLHWVHVDAFSSVPFRAADISRFHLFLGGLT